MPSCWRGASADAKSWAANARSRFNPSSASPACWSCRIPEREAVEVQHLRQNAATEAMAMQVVMEYERAQGRQVYDVHEKNLGYDITSLDLNSGELRLIEVKGLGAAKRHDSAHAQRAACGRRPARLLLAVRRHELRCRADAARADPRPGSLPVARGHQGSTLLA